jgi:hypothetical protein
MMVASQITHRENNEKESRSFSRKHLPTLVIREGTTLAAARRM